MILPQRSIRSVSQERLAHALRIFGRDEQAGLALGHQLGVAADLGRDHRQAAGHGFEDGVGDALRARGQREDVGQAEAVQHIANLLADEDYALLSGDFTNTNSSLAVQEVILADLLGRPNAIKLPVLLEAARTPEHAKAADARGVLELYLEHDYGTDWEKWQTKLAEWLKTHTD